MKNIDQIAADLPDYRGSANTHRPAELNLGPLADIDPTTGLGALLAEEAEATTAYDQAVADLAAARRAIEHATRDREEAVRAAVREGKALPAAPKQERLDQAARDAESVAKEHAANVSRIRQAILTQARVDYPTLRTAAVARLDQHHDLVTEALAKLRTALDQQTDTRRTIASLDAIYGADWAHTEAGMRRPTTKGGTPIAADAEQLRQANSQRQAQVSYLLKQLARELDHDKAMRQAIEDHAPENFEDVAQPTSTQPEPAEVG